METSTGRFFDYEGFKHDIPIVVRAMDNVVDLALYPLPQQREEALAKRRMGLGVTGVANALEALGYPYGSEPYINAQSRVLEILRDEAYRASVELSKEKVPFPLYNPEYLDSRFVQTLPKDIGNGIYKYGIRNSHLTSIAPTGTISLAADNVSSGIEPVFAMEQERTIINEDGVTTRTVQLRDYGLERFGVRGRTVDEVAVEDHVNVLCSAQRYIDSAISKTCNIGSSVTFEQFKSVYIRAYESGAKGCTTFRADGKRFGILKKVESEEAQACYYDPSTGTKSCE